MKTIVLDDPVIMAIRTQSMESSVDIDVFEAHRMLSEAEKQPTKAKQWEMVCIWLKDRLKTTVSESMARQFHETICIVCRDLQEQYTKNAKQIASSLLHTQESPTSM
jgi:hypothetical protein